ncbi:hypothetical protein PG995_009946 [Apiospora arundinis]|uniref:Uncharacterized protein n=1 Tax=Apiospora arundinis TaxID=335852 RepID=A0ABR2IU95_9PEZI
MEYDDLAHEPAAKSQKSEGHTTQERTGGNPKDSAHHQSEEHQNIVPIITKDTTLKPTQGPAQGPAGVSAPRPTPTSDKGSAKKSSKESTKESAKGSVKKSANKTTKEYSEKPGKDGSKTDGKKTDKESTKSNGRSPGGSSTKGASKTQPSPRKSQDGVLRPQHPLQRSGSKRSGHSKQATAEDANSDESTQGKESKPEPNGNKQHHVCKPFHEHTSPVSPSSDSQGNLGKLDPEPISAESEHTHGQGKKDPQHIGQNKVVAEVHPAGCDMHPDVKEEHLVTDNPRLGKMMAVYQKIEDKIKSKEDKEERAKRKQEEKEKKAREKKERREKRALEKQERKAQRARRREEAQATQTDTEWKTEDEPTIPAMPAAGAAPAPTHDHE